MRRPKIHKASIAVASDSSVVANVHGFAGERDSEGILRRAIELGGAIFIGVKLRGREARDVLARIDDAGHEGAGAAFVARERRRRKNTAKDAKKKRR
ncbi:MAG: hypothetical protein KIT84_20160 [Labilithrix sp.]|nr:hypothetical protein [Labilithrix sp.]MCW5813354.1 hypothetical protein [Labilithrix sp.]